MDIIGTIWDVVSGAGAFVTSTASGGLLGGGLRLITEFFKQRREQADRDHEWRMAKLQGEMAAAGSEQRMREQEAAGNIQLSIKEMDAYIQAIRAQGQKTGFWFVDTLNFSFRPGAAWIFLVLYVINKIGLMVLASGAVNWALVWTPQDHEIFTGILSFFYVGREFGKGGRR